MNSYATNLFCLLARDAPHFAACGADRKATMAFLTRGNSSSLYWVPRVRPALTSSAALSVRFVDSAAEIPSGLGEAGFPAPIEGPWIYEVLETSGFGDRLIFFYALVSRKGTPVAAAPAFAMDVPMEEACPERLRKTLKAIGKLVPSILRQRTLFVGYPGSPEGIIGIVPGENRPAVLLAFQEAFESKARELGAGLIIWRSMPEGIAHDLEPLAKQDKLFRAKSLPGAVVRFKSQAKNDYFEQLTASHRGALKRNLRRSAAAVSVSVEVLQQPGPAMLREMLKLFKQTGLRAKFKSEEMGPAWFERIAALRSTYFMAMRDARTGGMVAATAFFDRKPMLVARHVGFDYSKPMSWMLYYRLWDALVDWALANGFTSIYTGPTSYAAKIQTGHELIPLFNYLWHRNAFLHAIYRAVARRLDWAALDEDLAKFFKAHPEQAVLANAPGESDAR
jgi:hypothetical protein